MLPSKQLIKDLFANHAISEGIGLRSLWALMISAYMMASIYKPCCPVYFIFSIVNKRLFILPKQAVNFATTTICIAFYMLINKTLCVN